MDTISAYQVLLRNINFRNHNYKKIIGLIHPCSFSCINILELDGIVRDKSFKQERIQAKFNELRLIILMVESY